MLALLLMHPNSHKVNGSAVGYLVPIAVVFEACFRNISLADSLGATLLSSAAGSALRFTLYGRPTVFFFEVKRAINRTLSIYS